MQQSIWNVYIVLKEIVFVNYMNLYTTTDIYRSKYTHIYIYHYFPSTKNGSISLGIAITSTYPFPTSDVSKQKDIGLHD